MREENFLNYEYVAHGDWPIEIVESRNESGGRIMKNNGQKNRAIGQKSRAELELDALLDPQLGGFLVLN